jgi:hypothetical protein
MVFVIWNKLDDDNDKRRSYVLNLPTKKYGEENQKYVDAKIEQSLLSCSAHHRHGSALLRYTSIGFAGSTTAIIAAP